MTSNHHLCLRARAVRHGARYLNTLLVTGFTALALSACGGGGGGGGSGSGSGGGNNAAPSTPPAPTSSIGIFAGKPDVAGTQDGAAASAQFNGPDGVAVDAAGNVYVADSGNFTIRKISAGNVSTFAGSVGAAGSADGTGTAASFESPEEIAVSATGNLYVTDLGSTTVTVRQITPAGQVTTLIDPRTSQALQTDGSVNIAADTLGNVYLFTTLSSTGGSVLTQVTPAGAVNTISLTGTTGAPLGLIAPSGLTVDSANNIYIADDNHGGVAGVIYKVTLNGTTAQAQTLAGSLTTAGASDGPGNTATFDGLSELTVDPTGNLFANDLNNGTIREISPAGVVSTLAGTPGQSGLSLGSLPGTLPGIGQIAWYNNSIYAADSDDNVVLQINPAP